MVATSLGVWSGVVGTLCDYRSHVWTRLLYGVAGAGVALGSIAIYPQPRWKFFVHVDSVRTEEQLPGVSGYPFGARDAHLGDGDDFSTLSHAGLCSDSLSPLGVVCDRSPIDRYLSQ